MYRLFLIYTTPRQFVRVIFSLTMAAPSVLPATMAWFEQTKLAIPWFRRLVAGLLPRRSGINLRQDHAGSLVEKVIPRQIFLSLRHFFPVSINAPELHTHSFIYHKRYVILEIYSVVK